MEQKYFIEEIYVWENGIPFDDMGYALYPGELYDENKGVVQNNEKAYYAREATHPYGILKYVIGSKEDFVCFDFCRLNDDVFVLHSTVNSERGGFIDEFEYEIVAGKDVPETAIQMIEKGMEWLKENNAEHDPEYWNQDHYYFYRAAAQECGEGEFEELRFGDEPE